MPLVPVISRRLCKPSVPVVVPPEDLADIVLMHPTKGKAIADKRSVAEFERAGYKRVLPTSGAKRKG